MLYPKAHRKGFCLHGNLPVIQHGKGIPCAVPGGKHQLAAGNILPAADHYACHPALFYADIRNLAFKPHLASQPDNFLPHPFHHMQQNIRSDMGSGIIENSLVRAEFHQCLQYGGISAILILYQGIQFPVRKGARTALAKLHIGIRI